MKIKSRFAEILIAIIRCANPLENIALKNATDNLLNGITRTFTGAK
jgi:hypothetical protein